MEIGMFIGAIVGSIMIFKWKDWDWLLGLNTAHYIDTTE